MPEHRFKLARFMAARMQAVVDDHAADVELHDTPGARPGKLPYHRPQRSPRGAGQRNGKR
jgi:hypothetical protein